MIKAKCYAIAALVLCAGVPAASAQTAAPKPDAGTTVQAACIDEDDAFKMNGKTPMFELALTNKCERRMACKVFVYITSAKGVVQGHGRLVLAKASAGAKAKQAYTLRTKMAGGNSQSTRECHVL